MTDSLWQAILHYAPPYWAWCAGVALGVYALFRWLEKHTSGDGALNAELREGLTLLLLGAYRPETGEYSRKFVQMFDRVFAPGRPLSFLLRSALASMLAVAALAYLLGPVLGLTSTRGASDLGLLQFFALGMLINILPDGLSLIETRWLLGWMGRLRHPLLNILLLVLDLILSAAIILLAIRAYHLLNGTAPPSLVETVAFFSPYSVFFYSSFLTSVWAWLYFASASTIRMTSGPLSHVLNIAKKPFLSIGTLAAVMTFSGLIVAGAAFRLDDVSGGGVAARFDIFLCRHFPEDACDHMARLSRDEEDLMRRLEASCAGNALGYCIAQADAQLRVRDAHRLYSRACDGGSGFGCSVIGLLYIMGAGVGRDAAQARQFFRQGCDRGDINGCGSLGELYLNGVGGERDPALARLYYGHGCDGGDATSCYNLSYLYGTGEGGDQNAEMASQFLDKACKLDSSNC